MIQGNNTLPILQQLRVAVLAKLCNTTTRQPIKLENCSNPLRIQQVF